MIVSVGSHNSQPTVWTTANGRAWKTIVLPPPAGASAAALQQVAINGNRVVALGLATTDSGPAVGSATGTAPDTVPFAELSTDGGATWQQVPFSSPGPYTSFTALTATAFRLRRRGPVRPAWPAERGAVGVAERRELEAVPVRRPQRIRSLADRRADPVGR